MLAQRIEGQALAGSVAGQAAPKICIVTPRVVHATAQHVQCPDRIACSIKADLRQPRLGQQIVQFYHRRLPQEGTQRLIDLRSAPLPAIEAVTGDVRRTQNAQVGQRHVDLRLTFPHIQHGLQVFALKQHVVQRSVVHHGTTAGIDQPGALPELAQTGFVEQVPGCQRPGLAQRRVQADDVTALQYLVKADEVTTFGRLAWRIADQYVPAKGLQDIDQTTTRLPCTDHTVSTLREVDAFDFSQGQQAAEHVIHHAARIAARCAGPLDTGLLKPVQIQMIGADGAGADKPHRAAFEQLTGYGCHGAHQQDVGVRHRSAIYGTSRQAMNLTEMSEKSVEQGNIFVSNNAHGRLSGSGEQGPVPSGNRCVVNRRGLQRCNNQSGFLRIQYRNVPSSACSATSSCPRNTQNFGISRRVDGSVAITLSRPPAGKSRTF
ncbi:hypothetical protein ALQ39_05765 [Pseudomonas amygdali pv. eriobotryae]|uniref:Uncharacterized protein n=1 Tax=Pseudomonas amygdali pv. eriobotryae TaxID=129137 RepID=A0A3M3WAI1_PSEA0|nr:hypothetical protein ALQ39_05765 [Pseudomonas amygdali pv. eriobotryae]